MKKREKKSLELLGEERFIAFVRTADLDENSPFAVRLMKEDLDKGRSVLECFEGDDKQGSGYTLEVKRIGKSYYRIDFGCYPGPDAGDGGEWKVRFNEDNSVAELTLGSMSIS